MTASDPSRTRGDCVEDLAQHILAARPRIRSFLGRLSGVRQDVDDLLQDVMERAIRYRHAYDPTQGTLESWLLKTAFRTFLDHRENARRQPRGLEVDPAEPGTPSADLAELRDEVGFALSRLSAVEQDVVLRFHQRGETVAEIARALAMPEGTVKSHLHRARRKLAEERP